MMRKKFDFGLHPGPRERSFILHGKTDDHANDVHDYLKYLKFGYGRGTDDASMEIRHGRMTREEGIELVKKYDHVKPSTLATYLSFMQINESQFYDWIESMRDSDIWAKDARGNWAAKDWVGNHVYDSKVEAARIPLLAQEDRTFGDNNRAFYWKEGSSRFSSEPPMRLVENNELDFIVL
jgi:hypothetical protein